MINNKKVIGIVAEYDPFHFGHLKQLEEAKKQYNADYVCVVMSGCFMQRGTLSMFSPQDRAKMAIDNGVDLVLEIPVQYSLRDAKAFAEGGVGILNALNFVDAISFGCESNNIEELHCIASFLDDQDSRLYDLIKKDNSKGTTFVERQAESLNLLLGETFFKTYKNPNNMLAIHYLRALKKFNSTMDVIPIHREMNSHNSKIQNAQSPSANFIRNTLLNGNAEQIKSMLPLATYGVIQEAMMNHRLNRCIFPEDIILYQLKMMTAQELLEFSGISEGLENKIIKEVAQVANLSELFKSLKSRRYTLARLRRLLSYIALGLRKKELLKIKQNQVVRLLAYKKSSKCIVDEMFKCGNIEIMQFKNNLENDYQLFNKKSYALWETTAKSKLNFEKNYIYIG